jgi:Leu/Phe-tRNA-protein transferase
MAANEEDLRTMDNALIQAERHLKHAQIHLRDAQMMAVDEMYELGLTTADREELKRLLRFLTETIETVLFSGEKTRPILDGAQV